MPANAARRSALFLGLVLAATFLVYAPSLDNRFAMDDVHIVQTNPVVRELQPIGDYFGWHYWFGVQDASNLYRPITILGFALTRHWFGATLDGEALAHHLVNVLLHVLATALVFALLRGLRVAPGIALAATAVFGLHAIHSEVVAGIVGRAELGAFVFGALGLLAGLRASASAGVAPRVGLAALAAAAFFCAFGSKESAVAWLPFAPIYVLACQLRRDPSVPITASVHRAVVVVACAAVAVVAFLLLRQHALASVTDPIEPHYAVNPLHTVSASARWVTATVVWAFGLYKTVLPQLGMASDYGAHVFELRASFGDPAFLLSTGVLVAAVVAGLLQARRLPLVLLAVAAFFGFGFVTSNIPFATGTIFGERLYYTPSLALSLLLAAGLERPGRPQSTTRSPLVPSVIAIWLVASVLVVLDRNPVWRDDTSLFFTEVEVQPRSIRLHAAVAAMLGQQAWQLQQQGQSGAAERAIGQGVAHCRTAIDIEPGYAQAWINLGALQLQRGETEQAEQSLRRAERAELQQIDDGMQARLNLQLVFRQTGRASEARELLRETVERWPNRMQPWLALVQSEGLPRAELHGFLERGLVLGERLAARGYFDRARAVFEHLASRPDTPQDLRDRARDARDELR